MLQHETEEQNNETIWVSLHSETCIQQHQSLNLCPRGAGTVRGTKSIHTSWSAASFSRISRERGASPFFHDVQPAFLNLSSLYLEERFWAVSHILHYD